MHESADVIAWPSGLRRQLKALVRKGVGSNPTAVKFSSRQVRGGGLGNNGNISTILVRGFGAVGSA